MSLHAPNPQRDHTRLPTVTLDVKQALDELRDALLEHKRLRALASQPHTTDWTTALRLRKCNRRLAEAREALDELLAVT